MIKKTKGDEEIRQGAIAYARKNKKNIAREKTNNKIYHPEDEPVSLFMAGSPGAGKTEASKNLIQEITTDNQEILRIDSDELRNLFESYKGNNSYLFQGAVSILVDCILDFVFKNKQSFVLDGTLSNFKIAKRNIERSLNKKRYVQILYVYQNPLKAWEFVQARERLEGRKILKNDFISQYFGARDVVNALKAEFDKKIKIDLLIKELDGSDKIYKDNIDKIDFHIPEIFTIEELTNRLI